MCEMLAIRAERPLLLEEVWPYMILLDEYGVAGFGWGVVWIGIDGKLRRYRTADGIRRDPVGPRSLAGVRSTRYLIHLRRPSAMTTIAHRNAQPYLSSGGDLAFAHNGYFARHNAFRPEFEGRFEGTSDSEVGFLLYQKEVSNGIAPAEALLRVHRDLEGHANIGVLQADGELLMYAGNHENNVYAFDLGDLRMMSTALHSMDDFLFQTIFPSASNVRRVETGTVHRL
ncbi:MAG TPA: hypothetical protein GX517_11780 [Alicyclobacillus sp.]|nr:hypothetical protein [Alicyclobacillus sp.]